MRSESPLLKDLLTVIRQHGGFRELLNAVDAPKLTPFNPKRTANIEAERAAWIYQSGRMKQHNDWWLLLTGQEIPQDGEN